MNLITLTEITRQQNKSRTSFSKEYYSCTRQTADESQITRCQTAPLSLTELITFYKHLIIVAYAYLMTMRIIFGTHIIDTV